MQLLESIFRPRIEHSSNCAAHTWQ